jgi:gluconolactonase
MASGLARLVDPGAKLEKIAGGFAFTEGPVFSRRGYLLFTDLPASRIMKWAEGRVTVYREVSNGANGLTFDHQGRLLACEIGRVSRTEKDGSITVVADRFQGKGLHRPNDLVYAIDGSVYFSDRRGGKGDADPAKTDFSAVYQVTPKGEVRVATRDCELPNGVALAPDQQKLYVADVASLRVYDIAPDGKLRNGRLFADMRSGLPGGPDGMKTDEEGNVWVAGPGGIWIFDPRGERFGIVPTPETPSNCGWGDGFRNLYITARTSVYRLPTRVTGTRTY